MNQRIVSGLAVAGLMAFAGSALADHQAKDVQATIMKVQPEGNQVTVRTADGKEATFAVDQQTYLQIGDSAPWNGKLEDFKEGMRVNILFRGDMADKDQHAILMYPLDR
ncbi:MAG: hypothetical protein JNM56_36855 [Planctomycetia bacterium]|nr:hypothetical protein [Planctomycetia bacterium]